MKIRYIHFYDMEQVERAVAISFDLNGGSGKEHVITSNAEHKATLNVCKYLNGEIYSNKDATVSLFSTQKKVDRGYSTSFIEVDKTVWLAAINLKKPLPIKLPLLHL